SLPRPSSPSSPAATPPDREALDARVGAGLGRGRGRASRAALLRAARVGRPEHAAAVARLSALEADGRVLRLPGAHWALPEQSGLVAGRLSVNPGGFGFLVPDDPAAEDVYLSARSLGPAMHGDRALVRVRRRGRGGRPDGRVARILARGGEALSGTYRAGRGRAFRGPRDPGVTVPVLIAPGADGDARDGDLVVARVVTYPERNPEAVARVEQVLGPADDPRVQTEAVIHSHGLPL